MSEETSIVYKNIYLYRVIMNLLYTGSYKKRFSVLTNVLSEEKPSAVLELCFGDTYVAEYCKKNGIKWTGIDLNKSFVEYACTKGFDARCADLTTIPEFDHVDMCIISGSLYHFAPANTEALFNKIFKSTRKLLISEPVKNLSSQKGIIGYIARRSANAGNGYENFRYDEESFNKDIDALGKKLNLKKRLIGFVKKDIVILLTKDERN